MMGITDTHLLMWAEDDLEELLNPPYRLILQSLEE